MNSPDKTKDKLIASIRKTKAAPPSGEVAAAETAPATPAARPQRQSTASAKAPAKPRAAAKPVAAEKKASPDSGYSLGGLRWPD